MRAILRREPLVVVVVLGIAGGHIRAIRRPPEAPFVRVLRPCAEAESLEDPSFASLWSLCVFSSKSTLLQYRASGGSDLAVGGDQTLVSWQCDLPPRRSFLCFG